MDKRKSAKTGSKKRATQAATLDTAINYLSQGDLENAQACCEQLLHENPTNVDALHFLGVIYHKQQRSPEALALINKALELAPDYIDALHNRGNMLKQTGRGADACKDFRSVLKRDPHHEKAAGNLAEVLCGNQEHDKAIKMLQAFLRNSPDSARCWFSFGHALWADNRQKEAVTAFGQAVTLDPANPQATLHIGKLLAAGGETKAAIGVFRQLLARDAHNAEAAHMLAACTQKKVPPRASAQSVAALFDSFAGKFDQTLEELDYRAPGLVRAAFDRHIPAGQSVEKLCDLGCGTGLCGALFRDRTRWLGGVDLSEGMLEIARQRECFDELVHGDIVDYLGAFDGSIDAVVSADTLNYLGELETVFKTAAKAVGERGLLVFSLEHWPAAQEGISETGYRLNPNGRYSHRRGYVESTLHKAGWSVAEIVRETLRKEAGKPVAGLIITARRA